MTYYVSPRFLNRLAVHITKNYLDLPQVKLPLILGVHGRKGEGKTFQCELVYERMGVEVVHISGGELESPDAGDPARLIRLRYREAAELVRVRGKMAVLMINDLDAGAGRFDALTQYTVNTQLVNNTLMNIADNPTNVQLPGSYDETPLQRVPIVVTGNDFATLYAPLVRDGRMEKFYWEPDRADRIGVVAGIFAPDNLGESAAVQLVDHFPDQAIDFFGAIRSRIYDEQVQDFIHRVGIDQVARQVVNTKTPPQFRRPNFALDHLFAVGQDLVREQNRVRDMQLGRQYNQALQYQGHPNQSPPSPMAPPASPQSNPSANGSSAQPSSSSQFYRPYQPEAALGNDHRSTPPASTLPEEVANQVQGLLAQGYRVGMEYVDARRFRTNSWKSCAPVQTTDIRAAIAALEQCLGEHPQDYVRLIGIDPKNKRRVSEEIIQRP
jgi:ribulose bisphosphate carboxylase small subunit